MHQASSTIFLQAVIVAGINARGHALVGNPVLASIASYHIARMYAAGKRATILDGGFAVVTAAGRAVATDTVGRAAGNAAGIVTPAAEVLAATAENLGLAALALGHRGAAGTIAFRINNGTAVGTAQRCTVSTQWLVLRMMPLGRNDQYS